MKKGFKLQQPKKVKTKNYSKICLIFGSLSTNVKCLFKSLFCIFFRGLIRDIFCRMVQSTIIPKIQWTLFCMNLNIQNMRLQFLFAVCNISTLWYFSLPYIWAGRLEKLFLFSPPVYCIAQSAMKGMPQWISFCKRSEFSDIEWANI